jgi:hypothetical protein
VDPEQKNDEITIARVAEYMKQLEAGFSLSLGVGVEDAPPLCEISDPVFDQ